MKNLRRRDLLVFLIALVLNSCGQYHQSNPAGILSAKDSLLIHEWKSKSLSYFKTNPDSFANLQLRIASEYKEADQLGNWLNCYDTIINAYRKHEAYEQMLVTYQQLYKNIWREPADSFSLITLAESNRQVARYYYHIKSNYENALHFYDEGIKLITQANGWTPDIARIFYKAAGNCASRMDDYEKSISYHEKNVRVCREYRDTINLWRALNDLSNPCLNTGQFNKAEQVLRECYRLNMNSDSIEQKIDVCNNLADLFIQKNQTDSARKYLDLCFTYLSQWKNKEPDSEADVYQLQGEFFLLQKNFAAAEKSYSRSVELMMRSNEGRRRECGKIYFEFGSLLLVQNKDLQALQKFQNALNCFIPEFKNDDVTVTPDSSMLYDENGLFQACEGKGDANMNLFNKTRDQKYIYAAALNYHAAKMVLDKRERGMANESSRIEFTESVQGIVHKSNVADSLLRIYFPLNK